ncbi:hypothetical protein ASPBRDRAFT_49300 [Aspergillus brasiliensis CBS 101740]|uniref:Uncharacterized protein n=1 Tax=Aspergillus brasiliensis (strain CBS 101740 / IMI 381727 / IBT 21946) TaxID=767769 RepID=A0A1L9U2Q8_ASPBC|nr:hypothetical protein ASPBRDRAFT_49300 [Aspergillus brasiliensis CBS 101740]
MIGDNNARWIGHWEGEIDLLSCFAGAPEWTDEQRSRIGLPRIWDLDFNRPCGGFPRNPNRQEESDRQSFGFFVLLLLINITSSLFPRDAAGMKSRVGLIMHNSAPCTAWE